MDPPTSRSFPSMTKRVFVMPVLVTLETPIPTFTLVAKPRKRVEVPIVCPERSKYKGAPLAREVAVTPRTRSEVEVALRT